MRVTAAASSGTVAEGVGDGFVERPMPCRFGRQEPPPAWRLPRREPPATIRRGRRPVRRRPAIRGSAPALAGSACARTARRLLAERLTEIARHDRQGAADVRSEPTVTTRQSEDGARADDDFVTPARGLESRLRLRRRDCARCRPPAPPGSPARLPVPPSAAAARRRRSSTRSASTRRSG